MSFLDNVQMAFECPLAWDKLVGGERKKYCGSCDKHVTNLTDMTRPEARRFLQANQDAPICIRVEVDAMGRSVHRAMLPVPALGVGVLAVSVAGGPSSCSQETSCDRPKVVETVGQAPIHELRGEPLMGEPALQDTAMEPTYELLGDVAWDPSVEEVFSQETADIGAALQEVTEGDPTSSYGKLMGGPR